MEASSEKQKIKFYPDIDSERKLTVNKKVKEKKNKPRVFNKKRNPLSFVVDWQLDHTQE